VLASVAGPDALRPLEVELPGSRRAFASTSLDGKLYVVGGMRENFQPTENCAGVIEVASARFRPIACPSTARFSADLVVLGGRLYLLGGTIAGTDDENAARAIEVYDPATDSWTLSPATIPFDPRHVRAFAHAGRILVASTHAEDRALRLAWIDPSH